MIKAIETKYYRNGELRGFFRSRLEARWAVFFDALGLRWEYEKEGYDLGDAGWYLPDFYVNELGFVEVKSEDETEDRYIAKVKALAFCFRKSDTWVWVVKGVPTSEVEGFPIFDGRIQVSGYSWTPIPDWYESSALANPDAFGGIQKVETVIRNGGTVMRWISGWNDYSAPHEIPQLRVTPEAYLAAVNAARAARFEHGERP